MKHKDFCIFILTHGRANNVITDVLLKRRKCTYPIYYIIDNEDKQGESYYQKYGHDKVIMFDKKKYADMTDEGDNFNHRATITHARNASYDIAKQLGYTYFLQLDDDYTNFAFRFTPNGDFTQFSNPDITPVLDAFLDFYKATPFDSIAFAQGGDFIGGSTGTSVNLSIKRKAMNSFFCSTQRPIKFIGRMNEDVNTYTTLGKVGKLFGTIFLYALVQKQTQSTAGGITETYKTYGTYVKSFYTVMYNPSSVSISMIGNTSESMRIHHHIKWRCTVPKLLSPDYKKQV